MATLTLRVNGTSHQIDVAADTPLLWVLRDHLALTGTKFGCGIGLCGTCTVLIEGRAVRSCATPVGEIGDRSVITIEGLEHSESAVLQRAWADEHVAQCGYCQPGQIMNAAALLLRNTHPTDAEIDAAMRDNLCPCGTYLRIRRAIRRAAEEVGR